MQIYFDIRQTCQISHILHDFHIFSKHTFKHKHTHYQDLPVILKTRKNIYLKSHSTFSHDYFLLEDGGNSPSSFKKWLNPPIRVPSPNFYSISIKKGHWNFKQQNESIFTGILNSLSKGTYVLFTTENEQNYKLLAIFLIITNTLHDT